MGFGGGTVRVCQKAIFKHAPGLAYSIGAR